MQLLGRGLELVSAPLARTRTSVDDNGRHSFATGPLALAGQPIGILLLLDRREGLDLQQQVRAGQLRRAYRRALRRRWAEIAREQIGIFVEFGGRRDVVDRKDNVVDGRAAGLKARVDILSDLLDLRPHIALADDVPGLVECDLPADDQPMPAVAQCDRGRTR